MKEFLSKKLVVSISGASGTGKSTLALYIVSNFITYSKPYSGCCAWVQASVINFDK